MKPLITLGVENLIDWYDRIILNKDQGAIRDELYNIRNDINNKYNGYTGKFTPKDIINIANSTYIKNHPALLSCYKSEGNVLANLKKLIREAQSDDLKGTCQYCGIGKPQSFDHYLPISEYPEFSVLAINLIPCCTDCNGKKRSYWKENGNRGIINFYLDNIPNEQFLFAEVELVNGIPTLKFKIENINVIDPVFYAIVEKHYSRLGLIKLYTDESPDYLGELIRILKNYVDDWSVESLSSKLLNDSNQMEIQFGKNYWRAVISKALSESNDFLEYLSNQH